MKVQLKTSTLQDLVAKAVKGASNNKLIPITQMMGITVENGKIEIVTTDVTNYLYVSDTVATDEKFSVTVECETFAKLISKLTCETVEMELSDYALNIKGNGNYSIELPLDENGSLIQFPDPMKEDKPVDKECNINLTTIKTILNSAKASLLDPTLADSGSCYTAYYVGDKIISTNSTTACSIGIKIFDEPVLISAEMMNLLDVMTEENIKVRFLDKYVMFVTNNCTVYGALLDCVEEFPVDAINKFIDGDFESDCKLSKSALLSTLGRLELFIKPYDKNCLHLVFTKEGLQISSISANSVEIVPYKESNNFKDYLCDIDIEMFTSQIKSQNVEDIHLYYGNDSAIKLEDGNIVNIVALMEDE